ncbi:hypothetical protein [Luteitalea sp.]|uniref:hypothetical protein n=1 Tax=Luteitalea sp. TaxID=2004800 RepID=UPI0025B802EB|nr:hypothetical protein [Luteitalea sp.]
MTEARGTIGTTVGIAGVAWLIGALVLGFRWSGQPSTDGAWHDDVSLTRWAACWALLALLAVATAPRLPRWSLRVWALLPFTLWVVWELRHGALGPIPMVIYLVPTALVWSAALVSGDWMRRRPAGG